MSKLFRLLGRVFVQRKNQLNRLKPTLARMCIGSSIIYTFGDDEPVAKPEKPIDFPNPELTYKFLIQQSCALSAEQANSIATFATTALEYSIKELSDAMTELTHLYESSVSTGFALTDVGHDRVAELQEKIRSYKRQVSDLEILVHYVKKLLEVNSEVSFTSGAEFVSIQTSERLHSIDRTVGQLLAQVRFLELDLAKAQTKFIQRIGKQKESEKTPEAEPETET